MRFPDAGGCYEMPSEIEMSFAQDRRARTARSHPSFRMHLLGRVGFVEMVNPARGARLRRIFDRIKWPE